MIDKLYWQYWMITVRRGDSCWTLAISEQPADWMLRRQRELPEVLVALVFAIEISCAQYEELRKAGYK